MGGHKQYQSGGGFSQYLYHKEGETVIINGLRVEVLAKIGESDHHAGMPFYSNTADVYLKIEDKGTEVETAVIFINRKAILELDWGHDHHGKNGHPSFKKGEVHVHELAEYDGVVQRKKGKHPRKMTEEEIAKYGAVVNYANPKAKMK